MENNRTAKAIKNVKISILTYIVIIILQFANRSIFVGLLSDEYLGLNGLFSNVLQFLALAELGIFWDWTGRLPMALPPRKYWGDLADA